MAIIMRSSGQKRDQGDKRKQIYTWVGCGLVGVLTLISVIPNMGSEPQAPDYSKFSSSRMQDLAALPFGSDAEAGSFLRENPEYAAISNEDLLGSLFSPEERKERQAQDKAEGVPPPSDPEYREIAMQKAKDEEAALIKEARRQREMQAKESFKKEKDRVTKKEKERAAKTAKNKTTKQPQQQVRNQNAKTTPQTLGSSGSRGGSSAGSTGVTGSIWRHEGKDVKAGSAVANHIATAQDVAFAKDKGRNVGLDVAAIESMKGAGASSAEGAAAGSIDAFQGEVAAEDLEKDEEELGLDDLPTGLNEDLQDDLKRELSDDVNKQASTNKSTNTAKGKEYSVNDNCMDSNGKFVSSCFWSKVAMKGLDLAINVVTSCATGGGCFSKSGSSPWQSCGDGCIYNSQTGAMNTGSGSNYGFSYTGLNPSGTLYSNTSHFSLGYNFGSNYSFSGLNNP